MGASDRTETLVITTPSLEEALAMARTLEAVVEPRFIDSMGHMNVAWYVHLFDRGT